MPASGYLSSPRCAVRGVTAGTVTITVPPTIQRGNVLDISVTYAPLTVPLNANCIVLLPAPNPPYKETLVFSRKYDAIGVTGHGCPVFIPAYIQFQGTATVVVTVEGAGVGVATVNVTP